MNDSLAFWLLEAATCPGEFGDGEGYGYGDYGEGSLKGLGYGEEEV